MSDALVATPSRRASYTPTLAAWHEPRSSQLTISTRSSSSKPRRAASEAIVVRLPAGDGAALVRPARSWRHVGAEGHMAAAARGPQPEPGLPGPALGAVELGTVGDVGWERERLGVAGVDLSEVDE